MKYKKAYGEEMLRYFESAGEDLPSFVRFASQKGVDMEELRQRLDEQSAQGEGESDT